MNGSLKKKVLEIIEGRRLVLVGMGREGYSSFRFFRRLDENMEIVVADKNIITGISPVDNNIISTGDDYLKVIKDGDFIVKSPGVRFKDFDIPDGVVVSSQTDIFLRLFRDRTIGITGTKGKSTTSSLITHILSEYLDNVMLIGNIGVPAFDIIESVGDETVIVYELSSHQLEYSRSSPHISVLLNLFEEHLDHYCCYEAYRSAKWQIAAHQQNGDILVLNMDDKTIAEDEKAMNKGTGRKIYVSLNGNAGADYYFDGSFVVHNDEKLFYQSRDVVEAKHNIFNRMVAIAVADFYNIPFERAMAASDSFKGLPHRLEFLGNINGIDFVNDSIATIPQATINALESVPNTQTLILGGFDRGVDYKPLVDYLMSHEPLNIMMLGDVGLRLERELSELGYKGFMKIHLEFDDAVKMAVRKTSAGRACLLSPAAASYDRFRDFEERGNRFKELVMGNKR